MLARDVVRDVAEDVPHILCVGMWHVGWSRISGLVVTVVGGAG